MPPATRGQRQAQVAFARVDARKEALAREYASFARGFPTLIHTCGLCQAIAFARAKGEHHRAYADDLAAVLGEPSGEALAGLARDRPVMDYLRLSREALSAAVWLKRYVEALARDGAEVDPPFGEEDAR